jgi:hypothetical protein
MSQSVRHSWLEVLTNIGTGFVISALLQQFVVTPLWHLPVSAAGNLGITVFFTVVSVVRSYIFRRVFNKLGRKP